MGMVTMPIPQQQTDEELQRLIDDVEKTIRDAMKAIPIKATGLRPR